MAYRYRRYGRTRSGYSRRRRFVGFRRRSYRAFAGVHRPFRRGLDLARRSASPRIYRFQNTFDGGTIAVSPVADTTFVQSWFLNSSGLGGPLAQRFGQYRIDEVSVTYTPQWSQVPWATFQGGSEGVGAPYMVSSLTIGPASPPGTGTTTPQTIMGADDCLLTVGTRPHTRTFRPTPAAAVYVSDVPGTGVVPGVPGSSAGLRSIWLPTQYDMVPHGALYGAIRCPAGVDAGTGFYRITYSMKVSFRYFAGNLATPPEGTGVSSTPVGALPEIRSAMIQTSPPGAWQPPSDAHTLFSGLGAGTRRAAVSSAPAGGAGVRGAVHADDTSDLEELADELVNTAILRRTDRGLPFTDGMRAAVARRSSSRT